MSHAYDDAAGRAKGSSIPVDGLYAEPGAVSFGEGQRATYVSIMRVGGHVDDELPVKRVEVAGHPDKLFGRLRSSWTPTTRWCSARRTSVRART